MNAPIPKNPPSQPLTRASLSAHAQKAAEEAQTAAEARKREEIAKLKEAIPTDAATIRESFADRMRFQVDHDGIDEVERSGSLRVAFNGDYREHPSMLQELIGAVRRCQRLNGDEFLVKDISYPTDHYIPWGPETGRVSDLLRSNQVKMSFELDRHPQSGRAAEPPANPVPRVAEETRSSGPGWLRWLGGTF